MSYIFHALWMPDVSRPYLNAGEMVIWMENSGSSDRFSVSKAMAKEVADTLEKALPSPIEDEFHISNVSLMLPCTTDKRPLPSVDAMIDEGIDIANAQGYLKLYPFDATGIVIKRPLLYMDDIYSLLNDANDLGRPAVSMRFWRDFSLAVKDMLSAEAFLPAISPVRLQRKKRELFVPFWEPMLNDLDELIDYFARNMPEVCLYFNNSVHAPKDICLHFISVNVDMELRCRKYPQRITKKFSGTWLNPLFMPWDIVDDRVLSAANSYMDSGFSPVEQYLAWKGWRDRVVLDRELSEEGSDIRLGFKLHLPEGKRERWRIEWFLIPQKDPSFMLPLLRLWGLGPKERKDMAAIIGKDPENRLFPQMAQAARIYPLLWRTLNEDAPAETVLERNEALEFLKDHSPVLEAAGFKVFIPKELSQSARRRLRLRLRARLYAKSRGEAQADSSGSGYFTLDHVVKFHPEIALGDHILTDKEWETLVESKEELLKIRGEWVIIDREELKEAARLLASNRFKGDEMGLIQAVGYMEAHGLDEKIDVEMVADKGLAQVINEMRSCKLTIEDEPSELKCTLRDYQKRGLSWLWFMERTGLGALLADDMGLGKTIQVIALMVKAGINGKKTLLLAPTSVLGNWRKEIQRFAPHIKVMIHHGPGRAKTKKEFKERADERHLVITSYGTMRNDHSILKAVDWWRIVVDEAQNIKNPASKQAKLLFKLNAPVRIALTGTPVENRLMDIWSIFHFLNPGYLGTISSFKKHFEIPIQKGGDTHKLKRLKTLVQPFILRRLKTDKAIIKDLPDKVEQKVYCNLTREQASLYEALVREVEKNIEDKEGMERRGFMLSTLLRLKQICNHPAQFLQDGSPFSRERSMKLDRILDMLHEVRDRGESALVFTQFREAGDAMAPVFRKELKTPIYFLHGGVSRKTREAMIDEFQSRDIPSVFILSVKAGGVGITLTRANHVFHFDRWWNPAVEDQATDRAFRIGQEKNVFVYKTVTLGTLEERIDAMLEDKRGLAESIVSQDESWLTELDNSRFLELIKLSKEDIME